MPLGLFPLPSRDEHHALVSRFNRTLAAHDYASTWTIPLQGRLWHLLREPTNLRRFASGRNNAFEMSALAGLYRRAFAVQRPTTIALYETFHLGRHTARADIARHLGDELVTDLEQAQILLPQGDLRVSRAKVTGFSPLIVVSDHPSIHEEEKSRFVFCGRCSSRLAEAVRDELETWPSVRKRSLDLCTGSGIQALNGAGSFEEVWGGDINPRAVRFAAANADANGITHARFVESDLFAAIDAGGKFDLITANTPFLLLDEGSKALDGYGGKYGMEVELRLFEGLDEHLAPKGVSLVVASSAFVDDRNLLEEKMREIFGSKDYAIDLFPISQYYSTGHWRAYEAVRVRKCILYIVRARKDAAQGLDLRVHPFPALKGASFDVKVRLEREIARRRYLKSTAQHSA